VDSRHAAGWRRQQLWPSSEKRLRAGWPSALQIRSARSNSHATLLGFDPLNLLLTGLRLFRQFALRPLELFPERSYSIGRPVRHLSPPLEM
jgi:hypothetical protein